MALKRDERTSLRQQIGLLTVEESAAVLNCREIDVYRQIALGRLAFNRDGRGELLVSQAEIHGFAGSGCPTLGDTPEIDGDGWIAGDYRFGRGEFIKRLKDSPKAYSHKFRDGLTCGVAYLTTEARSLARFRISRQRDDGSPFKTFSLGEKLYAGGPEAFGATLKYCRGQLESKVLNIGERRVSLKTLAGSQFSRDIEQAIKEAF